MSNNSSLKIENGVLRGYTGAGRKVVIPDGVTSIKGSVFRDCTSLTSITIPDSVTSIGYTAFHGCKSLTSITIPDSVNWIRCRAFSDCTSLTSITIPNSVTKIGEYAFSGCKSLTSITIPDGVTSIGDHAFSDCKSLTSITIPDGVTSIGNDAFSDCTSLTSIAIPDGVTSIGDRAFSSCQNIKIAVSDKKYFVVDGYDGAGKGIVAAKKMLQTGKMDTKVKIPLGLKFQLVVKLVDWYDNADAKAYVKKRLTQIMKSLIDNGNLELVEILLEKTDLITKKNIDKFIQYAIDTQQQEIYLALTHYKDEIGVYTEVSKKF